MAIDLTKSSTPRWGTIGREVQGPVVHDGLHDWQIAICDEGGQSQDDEDFIARETKEFFKFVE